MNSEHGNSNDSFNEFERAARERSQARRKRDLCARRHTPEQDAIWQAFVFNYEIIKIDLDEGHYSIAEQYSEGYNVAEN